MPVYTNAPRHSSCADQPRSPYPLTWRPRIFGLSFGLDGPGGAS